MTYNPELAGTPVILNIYSSSRGSRLRLEDTDSDLDLGMDLLMHSGHEKLRPRARQYRPLIPGGRGKEISEFKGSLGQSEFQIQAWYSP